MSDINSIDDIRKVAKKKKKGVTSSATVNPTRKKSVTSSATVDPIRKKKKKKKKKKKSVQSIQELRDYGTELDEYGGKL